MMGSRLVVKKSGPDLEPENVAWAEKPELDLVPVA